MHLQIELSLSLLHLLEVVATLEAFIHISLAVLDFPPTFTRLYAGEWQSPPADTRTERRQRLGDQETGVVGWAPAQTCVRHRFCDLYRAVSFTPGFHFLSTQKKQESRLKGPFFYPIQIVKLRGQNLYLVRTLIV